MAKDFTPRSYQEIGIQFLLERPFAGLFILPGLGKTATILAAFKILKAAGLVDRMFVIAPLRPCYYVWPYEIQDWNDFKHFTYKIIHGKQKHKILTDTNDLPDVFIMNPEGLELLTKKKEKGVSKKTGQTQYYAKTYVVRDAIKDILPTWGKTMLVVDESTFFKNHSSQRFHRMEPLLKYFARRYILSGTPTPKGYINLWSQIYLLDKGAALGSNITWFRNTYFTTHPYKPHTYELIEGGEEAINKAIEPIILSIDYSVLPDLPKGVPIYLNVHLPDKAMEFYKDITRHSISEFAGQTFVATMAASLNSKQRQIANGGLLDENRDAHHIHDAKTDALVNLVEELSGRPALVGYEFNHDLERLQKAFPKAKVIRGGTPEVYATKAFREFNDGTCEVLLMQYRAGSHGLNLQKSSGVVVFYSMTYDLEIVEQFMRRVLRQGVERDVPIYYLTAKNTIDEVIANVLKQKSRTQQDIIEALKAEYFRLAKELDLPIIDNSNTKVANQVSLPDFKRESY